LRQRGAGKLADSDTEFDFVRFLETNKAAIVWWYKNGAGGKDDFAIPYQSSKGSEDLFFPDFVVLFQNGNLGIFDTKTLASDREMIAKHNALNSYAVKRKATIGSIIINHHGSWRYNTQVIDNEDSVTGWDIFIPSDLG
jgi:type III restriction enzyme